MGPSKRQICSVLVTPPHPQIYYMWGQRGEFDFHCMNYFLSRSSSNKTKLELTKHITPHAKGEPLLKRSSSHSYFPTVLQRFYLLSGLPTATVMLFTSKEFQSQFTKCRYLPMGSCNRSCVILRARCALNKEILDLLNEESVSGACSGRASL